MAETAKKKAARQAAGVRYGCHVDLEPGQEPDGCVKASGSDSDCVYADGHRTREGCRYWRPVKGATP